MELNYNEKKVVITHRTALNELTQTNWLSKMKNEYDNVYGFFEGYEPFLIDNQLMKLFILSARIKEHNLDISLLKPMDSADVIVEKFLVYMESDEYVILRDVFDKLREMDEPSSIEKSPERVENLPKA